MSDPLYDLLIPHLPATLGDSKAASVSSTRALDATTSRYLARLPKLDLAAFDSTEPQSLSQSLHSTSLALQALSSRSAKSLISSGDHLQKLSANIPLVASYGKDVLSGVNELDSAAVRFSDKYSRGGDNPSQLLEQRKRALLLARNIDRVEEILELPNLLSSAVDSAAASAASSLGDAKGLSSNTAATSTTYNAILDLHSHVKRLITLHPDSKLVANISKDASFAMDKMTTSLLRSLRAPNLKLAGAMRTTGWLRRVAPDLISTALTPRARGLSATIGSSDEEGAFGAVFLICRLSNLLTTLEALEPLKELADQETKRREANKSDDTGHQTERYLKRFIELFREQSFGIVSMFRSIFPTDDDNSTVNGLDIEFGKIGLDKDAEDHLIQSEPLPSAIATFPLHLVENILLPTLQAYLPNVRDKSARESLLMQVLYCAASLGRLGGDFSILITSLHGDYENEGDEDTELSQEALGEWVEVMRKHREQTARLESLAVRPKDSIAV